MNRSIKWQATALTILCVLLTLILVLMIFGTVYVNYLLNFVNRVEPGDTGTLSSDQLASATETLDPNYTGPTVDPSDVTLDTLPAESLPTENPVEIVNILLVGQDRRPGEPPQRSDSMILCTFNKKTQTITMTSFLRDTYVTIPGYSKNKLNAAYQFGGFKLLNKTLAVNFGVHVDANVEVDFSRFESIIDRLGGVRIELTAGEAKFINDHLGYEAVSKGWQTLNGAEALLYSRNRTNVTLTGAQWDFGRTERQRRVLSAIITAYKDKSLPEMLAMMEDILPMLSTDMTNGEILSYVSSLFPMLAGAEINTLQIPAHGTYESVKQVGRIPDVLIPELAPNRQLLWDIMNTD